MRAAFNIGTVLKEIDRFAQKRVRQIVDTLAYVGDEFVRIARQEGDYKDRTGNLRNSVGFEVSVGGDIKRSKKTGPPEARMEIDQLTDKIRSDNPHGAILICWAGMEYAFFVEDKDYDVISNAANRAQQILNTVLEGNTWLM